MDSETIQQAIARYYGETLEGTDDLEYDACRVTGYDPGLLEQLTDEVLETRYGCGSPIPRLLEGQTVLDLGCGSGADCFIVSQLVGPQGRVIGVDMTEEQIGIARRNIEPHMANFGYEESNVEFHQSTIEDLPLDDESVDVVISNCVINLTADKQSVFDEIWRVLRPGGEFSISDIVADRRLPDEMRDDAQLWSECLGGALYRGDLRRVTREAGFADIRTLDSRPSEIVDGVQFFSDRFRGFKLDLEDRCEDYGQVALYRGTIPGAESAYRLDDHHLFRAGDAVRVCRNTARMLADTRYADHFDVSEPLRHLGEFDCAPAESESTAEESVDEEIAFDSEDVT
ncbi:MAG: methyltransferase domain-containing protein, partial [Bradymonadaceae bacterium]